MTQEDPHKEFMRQLSLFETTSPPRELDGPHIDVSFLHKSFCIAGLPIRDPKSMSYARTDSRFSLTINGQRVALPGGMQFDVHVPWGAKSRLLLVWATTEAQNPNRRDDDRWLEIGRIKEWLDQIGVPANGKNLPNTKDQLFRLAFSSFTMILKDKANGDLFRSDKLIEGGIFEDGDLVHYAKRELAKVRWPQGLLLTQKAFLRFRNDSIPIPTTRLAQIANNAMAIDLFVFLCYRLPTVSKGETDLVTWRDLHAHFGSSGHPSKFKSDFSASIAAALNAYPEAKVDLTGEGLVLHHSDPAELKKAFVVSRLVSTSSDQAGKQQRRRRIARCPGAEI
jgi:hypothetical protein